MLANLKLNCMPSFTDINLKFQYEFYVRVQLPVI